MKRVFASVVLLLGWAVAACATEYQSAFGFRLEIPEDWLVMTKQAIKENPAFVDAPGGTAGNINPEVLRELKAKVESGSIEMFFDRTTSDPTFADNINVMVRRGQLPQAPDGIRQICESYPAKLAKYAGRNLAVVRCESRGLGATTSFYVEYEGVVAGTVTMQYQIPRPDNQVLLVTATCKHASVDKVRKDFEAIARSIRFI